MTALQVPVLGSFLDRLGLMLWPHYSRLIREQIDSITLGAHPSCLLPLAHCVPAHAQALP